MDFITQVKDWKYYKHILKVVKSVTDLISNVIGRIIDITPDSIKKFKNE